MADPFVAKQRSVRNKYISLIRPANYCEGFADFVDGLMRDKIGNPVLNRLDGDGEHAVKVNAPAKKPGRHPTNMKKTFLVPQIKSLAAPLKVSLPVV